MTKKIPARFRLSGEGWRGRRSGGGGGVEGEEEWRGRGGGGEGKKTHVKILAWELTAEYNHRPTFSR